MHSTPRCWCKVKDTDLSVLYTRLQLLAACSLVYLPNGCNHNALVASHTPLLPPRTRSPPPSLFFFSFFLRLAYTRVIPDKVASLQANLVTGGTVSEAKIIAGQPHNFVLKGGDAQVNPPPSPPNIAHEVHGNRVRGRDGYCRCFLVLLNVCEGEPCIHS